MTDSAANDQALTTAGVTSLVLRFVGGLLIILLTVAALSYVARDECEAVARSFVATFGYWGMALGTLLADGFHFPVPPQFYMLLAIASGASVWASFAAIAGASLAAGGIGFRLSRLVSNTKWVERKSQRPRQLLDKAFQRFGMRGVLVASLLPIPYSLLCYLAGLNRMPWRVPLLLGACRVPKLMFFYYLVYLGWRGV